MRWAKGKIRCFQCFVQKISVQIVWLRCYHHHWLCYLLAITLNHQLMTGQHKRQAKLNLIIKIQGQIPAYLTGIATGIPYNILLQLIAFHCFWQHFWLYLIAFESFIGYIWLLWRQNRIPYCKHSRHPPCCNLLQCARTRGTCSTCEHFHSKPTCSKQCIVKHHKTQKTWPVLLLAAFSCEVSIPG